MTRRHKGAGSLYWSASESTWIAEVTLPDGRKKKKRAKDKQTLRKWLDEFQMSVRENRVILDESTTFSELVDKYLSDVATHTLKPKTYSSYKYMLQSHAVPALGKLRLTSIQPYHLQSLYSRKLSEGLSKKTVHTLHGTIRRVLNEAVKWGLLYSNPTSRVTAPKPDREIPSVWTVEEASRFLEVVRDHRWYAIYLLALTVGARRGEILGLEWQNIDWSRKSVSIVKQVSEIDGQLIVSDPKTLRSRRVVPLPQIVIDALYPNKKVSGFVFTTANETPVAPRNLLRHFHEVSDSLALPRIRFHDLRHTAATILLQQNVHPKLVSDLLGHSTVSLTLNVYSHVIPGISTVTADTMDGLFKA